MINSKEDLIEYLKCDYKRYPKAKTPFIIRWLVKDEQTRIKHYIWVLRNTEYHINQNSIFKYFWIFWHKRLSNILKIYININSCDKGLRLVHIGGGIYLNSLNIGENFTATTGVVIGKKDNDINRPIIGNNVSFTIGAKAYGRIHIGDRCIIAPNTVVIKDVPSGSIVSGVPGKIIKSGI